MKPSSVWVLVTVFLATLGCGGQSSVGAGEESAAAPAEEARFEVHRGVNVSHWLSQSKDRGAERAEKVTAADFAVIKDLGFDHVRLPVDEVQLWDEEGNRHADAFALLHEAISWSLENDLRVIVDLHVVRSHHFNRPDSRELWDDPGAQEAFIGMWRQLSSELKEYPLDKVAYEPLNEAVAEDPNDWNRLIGRVHAELRALEPERVIVVGSNRWQIPGTFPDLEIPEGDRNIILSFHFYTPFLVTHYQAPWTAIAAYEGPVAYPGRSVDESRYEDLDDNLVASLEEHNGSFDRAILEEIMWPAIEVARRHGLPLYCGEFGAFPTTALAMRQRLYADMREIFDRNGIAWAHWNYKDDFPLVTEDLEPITELVEVLVPPGEPE
jgi:endoglucanase